MSIAPNFPGALQPEAFPLHWFLLEVLWPKLTIKEFFFSYQERNVVELNSLAALLLLPVDPYFLGIQTRRLVN